MNYTVEYHILVQKKDIPGLPKTIKDLVKSRIEGRLSTYPDLYSKPLRKLLKNYRSLRVGDYRIIFKMTGVKIRILMIGHREDVYEKALERIQYITL